MKHLSFLLLTVIALGLLIFIASGCDPNEPTKKKGQSIKGTVWEKGFGAENVSILVNGSSKATTNSTGEYQIDGLTSGTYVIKPNQPNRGFLPAEVSVTVTDTDADAVDFTRAATDQLINNERLWYMFRPTVYSVKQNTNNLIQLDLEQNALWFNNSQGGMVFFLHSGNFTITSRVNAVKKSDNNQPVACNICLGGLMVRNVNPFIGENYIHLVTGYTPNGLGIEYKTTTSGVSVYQTNPDGSAIHDLRIVRSGDTFTLYQKLPQETSWTQVTVLNRPDLPTDISIGLNIYTGQGGAVADLSVIYENITIQ